MYTKISSEFLEKVNRKFKEAKNIVITSHLSPDDDSISSVLAVYYYLIDVSRIPIENVKIIYTGERSSRWNSFKNYYKMQFVEDIADNVVGCDLLIILDAAGWKRISNKDMNKTFNGEVICIDHHPKPEDEFDLHLQINDSSVSSTAELIYQQFFKGRKLDSDICEVLLLGILGDTGNFRFINSKNSGVFIITKDLVDQGSINIEEFQSKYNSIGWGVYDTLRLLMSNTSLKEINGWPKFIISTLSAKEVTKYALNENTIDEGSHLFTDYLKKIEEASWGVVITPVKNYFSISLRSLPESISCRDIMEKTGFGGGHDRTAGGRIYSKTSKEAVNILIKWLKNNKPIYR